MTKYVMCAVHSWPTYGPEGAKCEVCGTPWAAEPSGGGGALVKRFFLSEDDSGHWYIVPVENRRDWEEFRMRDDPYEDEPTYVKRIGGHPAWVEFTDPREV